MRVVQDDLSISKGLQVGTVTASTSLSSGACIKGCWLHET